MKKKRWELWLLSAVFCGLTACAGKGPVQYSLISLDYLNNTFQSALLDKVETDINTSLRKTYDKKQAELAETIASAQTKIDDAELAASQSERSQTGRFSIQTYQRTDTIKCSAGASVLLMEGTAGVALNAGELIDVTSGTASKVPERLERGRRYLVAENTAATVTIRSETAVLGVMGVYVTTSTKVDALPPDNPGPD